MARPKAGMTPKKIKAANMLGANATDREVLDEVKVSHMTLWRWRQEDIFVDAVLAASDRHLAATVPKARGKLIEQIDDENGWLAQGAANSLLRERQVVKGDPSMQVVVSFSLDDTEPGMPDDDGENDV